MALTVFSESILKNKKRIRSSAVADIDRAMLRVTEYFAKSLEVIRYDTLDYGVPESLLLVLHCNYVCISYRF